MGACFGKGEDGGDPNEKAANLAIDLEQEKDAAAERKTKKLLLLGAGESGKSTLFKQCRTLYGGGYPPEEFKKHIKPIHYNIMLSIKELIDRSSQFGPMDTSLDDTKAEVGSWGKNIALTPSMAATIKRVWNDPGIQRTYEQRSNYQLIDSAKYFMDRIDEVSEEGYLPNYEDMLRVRTRTTGIIETEFKINGQHFKMFDVGGQQNERKKWMHCFEAVSALLWVCAISAYDMTLFEDGETNRVHESLNLFENTVNTEWFEDSPIILFLNKRDLFQVKIQSVPLTVCFPDYTGDNSFDDAVAIFKEKFQQRLKNREQKIYYHVTCAMDKDQMLMVFKSVKDIVIRKALESVGFY